MKLFIYSIVVTLCFTSGVAGQGAAVPKIVAEAYYFGSGMAGIVGEHLVARIYDDGAVEFDDIGQGDNSYVLKRSRLSKKRFEKLKQLLSAREIGDISEKYEAVYPTIDHTEDLKLKLLVDGSLKEIDVENFKPNLPKTGKVYPPQLIGIVCFLESVRKSAKIRFFFRDGTSSVC